jgi:hypothetical protein
MNAHNLVSQVEKDMQTVMSNIHSLHWNFIIMNLARLLKKSLLSDDVVQDAVKAYFNSISEQQFDFYYRHGIDSDHTLYSCREGHAILKEYRNIRDDAMQDLWQAGVCDAEVGLYETIASLSDLRSQERIVSMEARLVHNQESGLFGQLTELCEKYQHKAEAAMLKKMSQQLALYQKHNAALQQAFKAATAPTPKPWF